VTQHESSPGRPRGRRARSDNDVPEWAGYDAVPQDQREFPDLSPIRGQDARARDGRTQGEWVQDARLPDGPGYPPPGPGQVSPGRAPWEDEPWQSQQAAPQQQPPAQPVQPAQPAQSQPARSHSRRSRSAGTDAMEAFSERWHRRGSESREERRADRRKRRRLLVIGGGAAAVVIAVTVYLLTSSSGGGGAANLGLNNLVTTFLPGELQQVPNACDSVPGATLAQYLPGQLKVAVPPLNTGANSQCTWTLDKAPLYRVLEVNLQAYSPSGLASGDGSATFAAEDAYSELESAKLKPGPRSGQPPATVTDLPGMPGGSSTSAFLATQVFNVSGAITDVATVDVRYRNVIVTVVLNGLDHANKGNYGPVSQADLSAAAQTVAQEVTGNLVR
jgi:hypothetical protein